MAEENGQKASATAAAEPPSTAFVVPTDTAGSMENVQGEDGVNSANDIVSAYIDPEENNAYLHPQDSENNNYHQTIINHEEQEESPPSYRPFATCGPCQLWRYFTQLLRSGIKQTVLACSLHAARNPWLYIIGLPTLSLALVGIGFATNFELELDVEAILSPTGSQPALHKDWVYSDEGFPHKTRELGLLLHRNGENVLDVKSMERVFVALSTIRETEGFQDFCELGHYVDIQGIKTCRVLSSSGYFTNHSLDVYRQEIFTDEQLRQRLSSYEFANGAPVYHDAILGNWEKDATGNLTTAQSYLIVVIIPDVDGANDLEDLIFPRLDQLRQEWLDDENVPDPPNSLKLEMFSIHATQNEYQRAIEGDLYLVPVVAIMMCSFVAITFASYGWGYEGAKSRTLLGAASVFTITMSYLAGNGLMFICGVPFTPMTQLLPFVVFGIGLDDTFIITGAYFRTDPSLDVTERIRLTMEEVAHSISLTTITTIFAFLLGLSSSLRGVRWLCMYAFATIFIDFVYQVTLFVAYIVLDEWRIEVGRRDVCFCFYEDDAPAALSAGEEKIADNTTPQELVGNPDQSADQETTTILTGKEDSFAQEPSTAIVPIEVLKADEKLEVNTEPSATGDAVAFQKEQDSQKQFAFPNAALRLNIKDQDAGDSNDASRPQSIPERAMAQYADFLLRPVVKGVVLVLFLALVGACIYSTTLLRQEFKIGDFVPKGSYLRDVITSFQNYASIVRPMGVYFRHVDQTDADMQKQMVEYVNDLESLPEIGSLEIDMAGQTLGAANLSSFSQEVKPFCWVRDLQELFDDLMKQPELAVVASQNLTFTEMLNLAFANPIFREVYGRDIVRDASGNITASRCWLFLTEIDLNSVEDQIDLLHAQRDVGAVQPVNKDSAKGDWSFFFYDESLYYWEAYDVAVQELVSTIISGVIALTVISFVLINHWTAVFFVTPMIVVLYVNFLGSLQFFGLHINGIFYFCALVSIGLLVDFLLHVLMRYYETSPSKTRDERVKETLITMGSSIMLGGLTTFLGVVPLVFSTTRIFMIVFLAFFAMVVLGVIHGLVLLPVILSLVGPRTGLRSQ